MGEITESTYRKARIVGILGSGGSALVLFLILFFTYIITPIPPYPEGGGGGGMDIEVNLGYMDAGLGDLQQPDIYMPEFNEQMLKESSPQEAPKEEVLTQDNEETASVTTPPKEKKKPAPVKPAETKPVQTPKPKPAAEKPPTVNKAALYKPGAVSNPSASQGNTKGSGDQGSLTGSAGSATYGPGGSGGNGPGSGGGTGGGTGRGTGSGVGDGVGPGISFSLTGRSMVVIKKPAFTIQEEGIVVVEITVDKSGRVINATPGKQGSTTSNKTLYEAARKAALESRFNLKEDAADRQIGRITYHFKLQ